MDILQLRYFITVAACSSIQDAADSLYVSRQAVSRAILSLERELNINLFVRTHNGIKLTSTGDKYVGHARKLIEQYDELHKMMCANEEIVDIAICIPINLYTFFLEGINEFKEKYPVVNLKIIHCTGAEAHIYLLNQKVDVIIAWTPDKSALDQSDILIESPAFFMVNENSKVANKEMLVEADILNSPIIFYTDGFDTDYYKELFPYWKKGDYFVSDIMTVYDLVDQDKGLYRVPVVAISLAKKGYKFIKYADPHLGIYFYYKNADNLKMNLLKSKYCNYLKNF